MTSQQAEDEVFTVANNAWTAVAPSGAVLYFEGQLEAPPAMDAFYAEAGLRTVVESQIALGADNEGKRKYHAVALFTCQIYSPKRSFATFRAAKGVAEAVKNAFCQASPSGSIWFRAQRSTPVTGNEARNQVNVTVTCEYFTTK